MSTNHSADGRVHGSCEEILEGDPAHGVLEQAGIEGVLLGPDSDKRRRGERVALHPVDKQSETAEVVGAGEVLVGTVALAVDAVERCLEALQMSLSIPSGVRLCGFRLGVSLPTYVGRHP